MLKQSLKPAFRTFSRFFPTTSSLIQYQRSLARLGNERDERNRCHREFIDFAVGKPALQIGVKEDVGRKNGDNWVSVDKYDTRPFIDFNDDIYALHFEDEAFDAVACSSILEHLEYPEAAIAELDRVLKPGGRIWLQLPFYYHFHGSPNDYWRASPAGLRIWARNFKEIRCGSFCWTRTPLASSTFFYGEKS